jgi:hypothetical protein
MLFTARVEATEDGSYLASCSDPMASARGLTPCNALDKLRGEIRYRLEMCPCSSVDDDYVQLQVED